MAAPMEVVVKFFPQIDTDLSTYIEDVLEHGAGDFEDMDDIYDAIGHILHQVDHTKTEEDVLNICKQLLNIMKSDGQVTKGPVKILGSPVQLGAITGREEIKDGNSIWMSRRETNATVVDQGKLEKELAKTKQKAEKRQNKDSLTKTAERKLNEASASQQSSRREGRMESSGTNKTNDIHLENFDIAFGEKTLLTGATLHMTSGRRYGLVGRNGIGKTTLLRMLALGQLRIPSHITVLHVEQEVVGDDTIALQSVLECDERRESLLREEREISAKVNSTSPSAAGSGDSELTVRLTDLYQQLEAIDADKAPSKAGMILAGLGFTPSMQRQTTREFSGGWRMRLALARALFTKPDLLLLDEPTNMLDMKAIIWLENYLQNWATTILCVSHDRSFLNSICTDILHQHSQRLDAYKGDFETFMKTRTEKLKNQQKEYEAQLQYRQHIQVFIDRFRYNANRAAQVQSKLKLLAKLPPIVPVEKIAEVVLKFPDVEKLSPPILQLDEVTFYYSKDKILFDKVDVSTAMDSRICIVGENGAGKTTLLKILLGELDPIKGVRHAHRNLRIGYFSQHHVDQLDMDKTCVELLAERFPGRTTEQYRGQLGSFGVTGELAMRTVASLSGGQKSRVAFAAMSMANPNFFVLDEPTNHLDMETIEALGRALTTFKGGVMLVAHDERLIRTICKDLWLCTGGKVQVLEGGIDQYKQIVEAEIAAQ